jgi:tRNA G18 (ribose-2'-O)-methylase SpoU
MVTLTPVDNLSIEPLQIYHQLRDSAFREDNSFIADSPKVVNKVLESSIKVKSILATQAYYDEYKTLLEQKNIPILYVATKV